MKNALLAIFIISVFSGCYREAPLQDVRGMLVKHKWYMKTKAYNFVQINPECLVTQEATFNKDCTGIFDNTSTCDSTIPGITKFDWYLSSDSHVLHIRKLGNHVDFATLRVVSLYDDELTLQGVYGTQGVFFIYSDVRQTL